MRKNITGTEKKTRSRSRGISLIEACIVLVVAGLMASTTLQLMKEQRARQVIDVNNNRIATIKSAMSAFIGKNGRLPCPARRDLPSADPNYGKETLCSTGGAIPGTDRTKEPGPPGWIRVGTVPVDDLGLSNEYITDSWGHLLVYGVTETLTDAATFNVANASVRIVNSATGANVTTNALYTVVSPGKDGKGAWTADGQPPTVACPNNATGTGWDFENCDHSNGTRAIFAFAPTSNTPGVTQHFDDVLAFSTTVNDISLPTCGVGETMSSTDGVNFTCATFPPPPPAPPICGANARLTSNDGITYVCSPLPPAPPPPPPRPVCAAGQVINSTDGVNIICQDLPPAPAPFVVPTCPAGSALYSADGTTLGCKTLTVKSLEKLCKGTLQLTWASGKTTHGCTATCPAGTWVTGGGGLYGSVYSDNGRNSSQSGNGWACNVAIDSCSGGYAFDSGCNMHCSATCAWID